MASYEKGAGRIVKIRHNGVYTTTYMHLSGFARGLTSGKYVSQGELIGYVGSSGLSTGAHLDFRVYRNGSPIDPLKMESPSVDPVKPENMNAFDSAKLAAVEMLNDLQQQQTVQQVAQAGFIPQALMPENFFPWEKN
jgi:murein DD-endopeptidase MepM/ murein hydrolase activator NlpD